MRVNGESPASARSRSMRSEVRDSDSAGAAQLSSGPGLESDSGAMPGRTKRHQAAAHRDAAYPDAEGRLAAVIVQVLVHGNQSVLKQILGQRFLRHQAPDDAERGRRHTLEQRAPRGRIAGASGAELFGRDVDFRESLHLLWLRCRRRIKVATPGIALAILPPPRRDGGTGRRGGLKIRCPYKACGFDSLSRHHQS